MGKRWKRLWRDRSGEGYVDMVVLVLCGMLVLALCVQVLPVFVKKQQLDVFATELVREAEISGRVGAETDRREESLIEKTGLEFRHSRPVVISYFPIGFCYFTVFLFSDLH